METKERVSWSEYSLRLAKTASLRSEDPFCKVGACALGYNNMVVGIGYNGLPSGHEVGVEFWKDRDTRRRFMIHAETNCLSLFKKGEARVLATTLLPCSFCATAIAAYDIPYVVYDEEYEKDKGAMEIFKFYGITLIKMPSKQLDGNNHR
jgi:dCMP deaminase